MPYIGAHEACTRIVYLFSTDIVLLHLGYTFKFPLLVRHIVHPAGPLIPSVYTHRLTYITLNKKPAVMYIHHINYAVSCCKH